MKTVNLAQQTEHQRTDQCDQLSMADGLCLVQGRHGRSDSKCPQDEDMDNGDVCEIADFKIRGPNSPDKPILNRSRNLMGI